MEKILVLATAPTSYCRQVITNILASTDSRIAILANRKYKSFYDAFSADNIKLYYFKNNISILSFALWRSMVFFSPKNVIVCVHKKFFHENVLASVVLIKRILLKKTDIQVCNDHKTYTGEYMTVDRSLLFFVNVAIILLAYSIFQFAGLFVFLSTILTIVFYEYILKKCPRSGGDALDNAHAPMRKTFDLSISIIDYCCFSYSQTFKQDIVLQGTSHRLSWSCTQDSQMRRATSLAPHPTGKDKILVLGCSQTYGQCVSDNETFAWKLQDTFKNYTVINLARCGAGANEMYLRLTEQDMTDVKFVVFGHIGWHLTRNTGAYGHIYNNKNVHAAVATRKGVLKQLGVLRWKYFPYRKLTLFSYFEMLYNKLLTLNRSKPSTMTRTQAVIFQKMQKFCKDNAAKLLVANIDDDFSIVDVLNKEQIDWVCGLNLEEADATGVKIYTHEPVDLHINAKTHAILAERISQALRVMHGGGHVQPEFMELYAKGYRLAEAPVTEVLYPLF